MSRFVLGLIIGCNAGALGTLILMIVVRRIPDGESLHSYVPERWRSVGLILALVIGSGLFFGFLDLHRVAFATSILLLLVFVSARVNGMLVSWIALAIATLILCMILPPAYSLSIADPQDQILIVFFVFCGVVGTRLIDQKQRA